MRVLATCFWSVLVDVAIIVVAQERTRGRFENKVAIFIDPEVLFLKISRSHTQPLCESFDVSLIKDRAGGLATVGALEAISFGEDVIVQSMEGIIHLTGIHFFETREEFPILGLLIPGLRFKLFCVHLINDLVQISQRKWNPY